MKVSLLLLLPLLAIPAATAATDVWIEHPSVVDLRGQTIHLDAQPSAQAAWGRGTVVASSGADGVDLVVKAPIILVAGATLRAGDGGDGGHAWALGPGLQVARAGHGGDAGRIVFIGRVVGDATLLPARAGDGGNATAESCTGADGGSDAETMPAVSVGDGQDASAEGTDGACGVLAGGRGGDAYARGGDGGLGQSTVGGRGGSATAVAGTGGAAMDACFGSYGALEADGFRRGGDGGDGGDATAIGGAGGFGMFGGPGGAAHAESTGGAGGMGHVLGDGRDLRGNGGDAGHTNATAGRGGDAVVDGGPGGTSMGLAVGGSAPGGCSEFTHRQVPGLGVFALTVTLGLARALVRR